MIPEHNKSNIFENKFTTKKDRTEEHGYGLYITKYLVEKNNGKISVRSDDAYSGTSGRLFRRHPDTKPELSGHLADRFDFTVTIPKLQYCGIV